MLRQAPVASADRARSARSRAAGPFTPQIGGRFRLDETPLALQRARGSRRDLQAADPPGVHRTHSADKSYIVVSVDASARAKPL